MPSRDTYRIADEPRPGALERFVVNPIWPLFGMMLGGAWLGLPWFVVNGAGLGSATLKKEILLAVAGFAGAAVLTLLGITLLQTEVVPLQHGQYLGLVPMVWKLGIGYALLNTQRRSFALWEHYGGQPRHPTMVLVAALLIRTRLSFDSALLTMVLL